MNTIFGYFGISLPNTHSKGAIIKIGRYPCKVVLRLGKWHWLKML